MRWIEDAKRVAYRYKANKTELDRMARELNPPGHAVVGRSGRISKPVEAEVMRRFTSERAQHLERSILAVDFALATVADKPNGVDTLRLFDLVYYNQTHKLFGAAVELNISERTAWRYNAYLLKMIAIRMGYIPSP